MYIHVYIYICMHMYICVDIYMLKYTRGLTAIPVEKFATRATPVETSRPGQLSMGFDRFLSFDRVRSLGDFLNGDCSKPALRFPQGHGHRHWRSQCQA